MRIAKIPKLPLDGYRIVSSLAPAGAMIDVYGVEIVGYLTEPVEAWQYKFTNTVWQMVPRTVVHNDQIFDSSNFDSFCFDLYSVKLKVEEVLKSYQYFTDVTLGLNITESSRILKRLFELDGQARIYRDTLKTLEETKFPDIRSLYEKL